MRKKLVLLLILFVACKLSAQEVIDLDINRSYTISIGPKAGVNATTLSGNPVGVDMDAQMGYGFHAGLAANLHLGRHTESSKGGTGKFGLRLEALYSQLAVKIGDNDLKMDYLAVPLLAEYYFTPRLNFEIGPTFMSMLKSSPDNMVVDGASIATSQLKGNDVLLSVGAGYEFKNGLTANLRYNVDFTELAGNMPCKNNVLQVSIGWLFKIAQ